MNAQSAKIQFLLFGTILIFALAFSQLIVTSDYQNLVLVVAVIFLTIVGLMVKTEHLIYLTLYVLLAGSSYDYQIRTISFYLRFGALALFIVRLFPLIIAQGRADKPQLDKFQFSAVHFGMLGFLLVASISIANSVDTAITFKRVVALGILIGAVFFHIYWTANSFEKMKKYMTSMILASTVLLIVGFVLYAAGVEGAVHSTGRLRLFLFGPNELGYLCSILFPAAFWYFEESRTFKRRIFSGIGMTLFVLALVMTSSRGSLVCFAISTILFAVLAYRKKLTLYLVLTSFVVALTFVFSPPKTEVISAVFEENIVRSDTLDTGSGRLSVWKTAWRLSQEKPILGYGYGTTQSLFDRGYFLLVSDEFQGGDLHNGYLEIILQLGWVGMAFFLVVVVFAFFHAWRANWFFWGKEEQRFASMLFACFFAGLSSGFLESWIIAPGSIFSFPFWTCIALLVRLSGFRKRPHA